MTLRFYSSSIIWLGLSLWLSGWLSLSAQPYLASHRLESGSAWLGGHVGGSAVAADGSHYVQLGSAKTPSLPIPALTMQAFDRMGQPNGTLCFTHPGAGTDAQWLTGCVAFGHPHHTWGAATLRDSNQTEGVLFRLDEDYALMESARWPAVRLQSLLIENGQTPILLGQGPNAQGHPALRLLPLDSGLYSSPALTLAGTQASGGAALADLPDVGEYLVLGWRDSAGSRWPVLTHMVHHRQVLWQRTLLPQQPMVAVTDLAYANGHIALTGSALAPNGVDTLACLVITDDQGSPLACQYYGLQGHTRVHSLSLTPLIGPGNASSLLGWILGGRRYAGLQDTLSRSWVLATNPEGAPQWSRTYSRSGSDLPTADAIHHVQQVPGHARFWATGPLTYYRPDNVPLQVSQSLSADMFNGQVGLGGDDCSSELELTSFAAPCGLVGGGTWASAGGLSSQALIWSPGLTSTQYCSASNRQGTPTQPGTTTDLSQAAPTGQPQQVAWYDLQGRLLHRETLQPGETPRIPQRFAPGLYVLRRSVGGQVIAQEKVMRW